MGRTGVSGAVLAGGLGLRMGRPKVELHVHGEPLLLRQLRLLAEAGVEERWVCLSAGQVPPGFLPGDTGILTDTRPGLGPLSGLERALQSATRPFVLVLAIDLPHLSADFLRTLLERCREGRGCVPRVRGRFEPLAAVYPASAWTAVNRRLDRDELSLQPLVTELVSQGALEVLDLSASQESLLLNWNRPGDFTGFPSGGLPNPDAGSIFEKTSPRSTGRF
jgi:molybdopterin-guanine dinucleotide biosynthesis protein A